MTTANIKIFNQLEITYENTTNQSIYQIILVLKTTLNNKLKLKKNNINNKIKLTILKESY